MYPLLTVQLRNKTQTQTEKKSLSDDEATQQKKKQKLMGGNDCPNKSSTVIEAGGRSFRCPPKRPTVGAKET